MQDHVARAGATGVVLGVSGGLDSAVVAALAVDVFGAERVTALLMPAVDSDAQDEADGQLICRHLGLQPTLAPLGDAPERLVGDLDPAVLGNVKARLRMTRLYAEAQSRGALVAGTGNKSELLIGYFTKHGDGGSDLLPIGDLYKSQVKTLARHLGIPPAIIEKPPSAGLRPGQTDEGDLGLSYERLDAILKGIELNQSADSIVRRTGESAADVARIAQMVRKSEHKRRPPLVPKIGARTVGIDWRRSVHWDA